MLYLNKVLSKGLENCYKRRKRCEDLGQHRRLLGQVESSKEDSSYRKSMRY